MSSYVAIPALIAASRYRFKIRCLAWPGFLLCLLARRIGIRHPLAPQARHEFPNSLLIQLVIRILPSSDQLCKPRASLKQTQICCSPQAGPVVFRSCCPAGPDVERDPNGLLG